MLQNFLIEVAGIAPNFTIDCRKESCINYIRETVGSNKVLVLVSGGVDSTVCAALLKKALPADQIFAVHIDNGTIFTHLFQLHENLPQNCKKKPRLI